MRRVDRAQRALRERRERADRLDLVAEELDAERLAAGRREDVDEPAADGELAALLDALDALVARERERLREPVDARLVARARARSARAAPRPAAAARRAPCADAQTSPPRASTSSARARSPTRCGGGSSPDSQRTPRLGSSADVLVAEEPAGGLGGVARVGVLGQQADERPLELLVERREHDAAAPARRRARASAAPRRSAEALVLARARGRRREVPGGP